MGGSYPVGDACLTSPARHLPRASGPRVAGAGGRALCIGSSGGSRRAGRFFDQLGHQVTQCRVRPSPAVGARGYDRRVSAKPAVVDAPSPADPSGVREVRVSSPDRVLWPAEGMADGKPVTKLDMAHYLVAVADPMLRALGD